VTLFLPPPTEKLVATHGGPNQTWYEQLRLAFARINSLVKAFGDLEGEVGQIVLGTAAAENIGTSGATVPLLNTANQWSKQQYSPIQTLTDAATIAWDLDTQQTAIATLGGNRLLGNATNAKPGATYQLAVVAGAFALTYGTMYKFPGGEAPETTGNCLISFFCPMADVLWCVGALDFP
jgi:hypothetical protein